MPTLVHNSKNPNDLLTRVSDDNLTFTTNAIGRPGGVRLTLMPFYSIHHQRYNVYWTLLTESEWAQTGGVDNTYPTRLEKATIDIVTPSLQQSEIEHDYVFAPDSTKSYTGFSETLNIFPAYGYWRDYRGAGNISYTMKIDPAASKNYLMAVYWGSDVNFSFNGTSYTRRFNVIAGGSTLAADEVINNNNPGQPYVKYHEIPQSVIDNAVDNKIVVKFESTATNRCVGGLFSLRTTSDIVNP